ncbi:serine carboxypeptidase-like 7 isoform X3 [Arabidopsis lyrata subsp. lyrata]|uniref:serine carboxypeptidase-like 7 isoform X3 n=1 Tax=Arabidopsis lyrata subsp. lyrata TaxID=81972 RepID=UPI000A29A99E|nr:serine carboxypeptidase-like 7 isoform X3 [Arabidopsis lyrata subsp. lyrata]|eukprot:XP_020866911.1 serine carboxypeptidase-like 7 isoform X3 [Arabidopsis lyrata subsp. lyrata]
MRMCKEYLKLLILLLGLIHHVYSASIIRYLPGFVGPLPFELETGYIGVGEAEEVQLFYYFIKSERNPEEDPLLLWLTGGPGCSCLFGLLFENGPVTINIDGYNGGIPSLVSTPYSWTKVANIIYLDQPVGTGFSYSTTPLVDIPSDTGEAKRVHEFLHKWLGNHPDFVSNPFFVTGSSYAGKVVPAIVQEISEGNYICCKPQINLQGYVLGNPGTDVDIDPNYRVPFAHGMALICDELYESLKRTCGENYINVDPRNAECLKLTTNFKKLISGINMESILSPSCEYTSPDCYDYGYSLASYWANDKSVRKVLQVKNESITKWALCYRDIPYKKDIISSVPYHINNSINGYSSLIYSGDHDMGIPFLGTQAWIRSLNYSIIDDWRPWMINNQVAGYTITYANKMTFATIKASGHTLDFKPMEGFIMFQRWISGQLM